MNDNFNTRNAEHRNLLAKLNNAVADLNFYAYRFLTRAGLSSTPRTGLADIDRHRAKAPPERWPEQLDQIANQNFKIINATPETANELFRETWHFVHDFDHIFRHDNHTRI